jgi:hypothetical protein
MNGLDVKNMPPKRATRSLRNANSREFGFVICVVIFME